MSLEKDKQNELIKTWVFSNGVVRAYLIDTHWQEVIQQISGFCKCASINDCTDIQCFSFFLQQTSIWWTLLWAECILTEAKAYYFIYLFGSIELVNETLEENIKYDLYPKKHVCPLKRKKHTWAVKNPGWLNKWYTFLNIFDFTNNK